MQQFQYEIQFELSFCFSNVLGFAEGERIVREARQGRARGRRQERARQAAERYQGADGHQGHRGADGQVIHLCNFPRSLSSSHTLADASIIQNVQTAAVAPSASHRATSSTSPVSLI